MDMHKARWPGWQAVRALGSGRAGTVFEIQHHGTGCIESGALKVMQIPQDPDHIQQQLRQGQDLESVKQRYLIRMEDAAAAYSQMASMKGHPNVLACEEPMYEPQPDGVSWELFVKTELLQPVSALFARGASPEQVLRLGADISTALALCQERGLIHGGVKPSNVFVTGEGRYKLGDFGAARATGVPCGGDERCMAPEIYWGMEYDGRADVYALGILLYTLLNGGCLPLTAPGQDVEAVLNACTRRLSGEELPLPAGGSPALQQIVMRACAYEPAKRYGSAMELRGALLTLLGEDPAAPLWPPQTAQAQPAHPEPVHYQGGTWRPEPAQPVQAEVPAQKKKNKGTLFLLLAVAAALLVVGVVCFFTVHIWSEASCNEVKQCVICGKTGGKAADHRWEKATCVLAETCQVCGETKGEPLGHSWIAATRETPATCSVCAATEGDVLMPTLWAMRLISSGWQGGHQQQCDGRTVSLAFPNDPGFADSQVTVLLANGEPAAADRFSVEWAEGTVTLTPAATLEPGVYNVQFESDQGGAMLTLCYGFEGETYLSTPEHFWSGCVWRSEAGGFYLAVSGGEVSATDRASEATQFDSAREMIGIQVDASGKATPVAEAPVQLQTMIYARDGEDGLVVFAYEGWYLACDGAGTVYLTQELNEDCFWRENR